jgi:hypothetical protein
MWFYTWNSRLHQKTFRTDSFSKAAGYKMNITNALRKQSHSKIAPYPQNKTPRKNNQRFFLPKEKPNYTNQSTDSM